MGGYEGTAICYLFLVLFFIGTAWARHRTGKPLHAIGLVLLALLFLRLGFSLLRAAGHNVPSWVSEEGVIFANAITLVVVSLCIMLDELLEYQRRQRQ